MTAPVRFAELLTAGVKAIKTAEHKDIRVIQDELGYALGRNGGSMIEYWRKGQAVPAAREDIECLAQELVRRGQLDEQWLLDFLSCAGYPSPLVFCRQVFPGAHPGVDDAELNTLIWEDLQAACRQVTLRRSAALRKEHAPELFQPRPRLRQELDSFLASDRQFLVLAGKSGSGKSSFLASLLDDPGPSGLVCLLVYEGRAFLPMQVQASDTVLNDLAAYLPGLPAAAPAAWLEIAQVLAHRRGQLLVVVDAINENQDSLELLRQLNYWAESFPLPSRGPAWLKIVISCRAQVWRLFTARLRLDEARFHQPQQPGSDPETGRLSVSLERFTPEELQAAYRRYQQRFELYTDYEHLPESLKTQLREPLLLDLLARTYAGRPVGELARLYQRYDDYFAALYACRRLRREDIYLLEAEIVPRLLQRRANQLSFADLDADRTQAGQPLAAALFGSRMAEPDTPFASLVDAGVLAPSDPGAGWLVRFQHESLFDYFVGRQLVRLAGENGTAADWYASFLHQVRDRPYLWGALEQALLLEVMSGTHPGLLPAMLRASQERLTKTIISHVLVDVGRSDPAALPSLLQPFMEPNGGELSAAARLPLARAALRQAETRAILSQQLAGEVARRLGMTQVLVEQVMSDRQAVRQHAVQQIIYLWHADPVRCLGLLNILTDQIQPFHRLRRAQRTLRALEGAGQVSLFIALANYLGDEHQFEQLLQLQRIWQPIIARLLYVRPGQDWRSRVVKALFGPLRQALLSRTAIDFVIRVLRNPTSTSINANMEEFKDFYRLPLDLREEARFILQMIDPQQSVDLDAALPGMLTIIRRGDRLSNLVLEFGLRCQHFLRDQDITALVFELYQEVMRHQPPNLALASLLETMFTLADNLGGPVNPAALTAYRQMVTEFYDLGDGLWLHGWHGRYMVNHFGKYVSLHWRLQHSLPDDLIAHYTSRLRQEKDTAFSVHFLGDIRALLGDERYTWEGLQVLAPAIDFNGQGALDAQIVTLLARFGATHPDELQAFWNQINVPEAYRRRIENSEAPEHLSDVTAPFGITGGAVVDRSPALWRELQWLLGAVFASSSLAQLHGRIAKRAVNVVYGEKIFDLPDTWE